jgi:Trk-type K+ transport system membrane component
MLHLTPRTSAFQEWRDIMSFILKYPRRVYTHLFPSNPTWWLVLILFILNGIDFISFEALNRTNPTFIALSPVHRNLDGLVQTIFIRSAGFTVISISSLRIGLQVLYVPMMFISAFPVAITMRSSNVYEERSLGIYASELRAQPPPFSTLEASGSASLLTHTSRTRLYFLRTQISQQLSHDFWFVVICSILIIWIETGSIDRDPLTFSVFNILFEVVSAYACVGLSIGLPDENYALSGKFHTSSKVILCCLMFRGRHRDLPVAIDRAVQLPDGILEGREQEKGDRVSGVLAGEL